MARPPRIQMPGALYHVVQRGNYRQPIFVTDRDRERFEETLGKYREALDYRIHAYCLMGNHVHLLLETRRANLSKVLQRIMGSYTLYYNRKRQKVGHLFQGRSKAFLVDGAGHLLDVSRYIHLNPVRAEMIKKPEDYRWSSLKDYAPGTQGRAWVTTERVLGKVENDRGRYLRFVYAGMKERWEPQPLQQLFYGTEAFAKRMMDKLGWKEGKPGRSEAKRNPAPGGVKPDRVLRTVAAGYRLRVRDMVGGRKKDRRRTEAREAAMVLLRKLTPLTLGEVGALLGGVSHGRVSQAEAVVRRSPLRLRRVEALGRKAIQN